MEPDIAKAFVRTIQQIKDATAISRIEENTVAGNKCRHRNRGRYRYRSCWSAKADCDHDCDPDADSDAFHVLGCAKRA